MTDEVVLTAPAEANTARALNLIALFVVGIAAFLIHFNVIYAPLQGDDIPLYLLRDAGHQPHTALADDALLPGAPLTAFHIGALWAMTGGNLMLIHGIALVFHVICAMALYLVVRAWTNSRDSILVPLLTGLLMAATPAAVGGIALLHLQSGILSLTAAFLCLWCFLRATKNADATDGLWLALAALFQAAAFAAHQGMALLPVVVLVCDVLRIRENGASRRIAWSAIGLSVAIAAALFAAFPPVWSPSALLYWGSGLAALVLGRILTALPVLPRGVVSACLALAAVAGAVLSFQQGLQHVERLANYERRYEDGNPASLTAHALQCLAAAGVSATDEERFALFMRARDLWQEGGGDAALEPDFRYALGTGLLTLGRTEAALEILAPLEARQPFEKGGAVALLARLRTLDEKQQARELADGYAALQKQDDLADQDQLRFARALLFSGNMAGAAAAFASTPDLDEKSMDGLLKKQALAARNAAFTLRENAQKQMVEKPTSTDGFIASAESNVVSGNSLRAFYWLELVLRKDPKSARAWELMGVIFARYNQAEQFAARWGSLPSVTRDAWLKLARQTAMSQAWDSAFVYASRAATPEGPCAEEFMAAFAIEMKLMPVAETWLKRATENHPEAPGPWLYLSDFAFAANQPEEAQRLLDEARKRGVPETEIQKRIEKRKEAAGAAPASPETPAAPVRTYMQ